MVEDTVSFSDVRARHFSRISPDSGRPDGAVGSRDGRDRHGSEETLDGSSDLLNVGPAPAIAIAVAVLAAAGVRVAARLGHGLAVLRAGARAALQLGAVSLVIAAVVSSGPLTVCFVAVMLAVASWTAGRRHTEPARPGVVPADLRPGRSAGRGAPGHRAHPVERAGGAPHRRGADRHGAGRAPGDRGASYARRRGRCRAVPWDASASGRSGDRPTGRLLGSAPRVGPDAHGRAGDPLIGAFVGMLLGGAGPFEAGAVQAFVLAALLLVESVAIVPILELVARGPIPHTAPD